MKEELQYQRDYSAYDYLPCQRDHLIQTKENENVSQVFKLMLDNDISSIPVMNREKSESNVDKCIGIVDKLDIVSFVLHSCSGFDLSSFNGQIEASNNLKLNTAKDIMGVSFRNPFFPVDKKTSLFQVMQIMIQQKIHRIPMIDEKGTILTIVTQFQVVKTLSQNIQQFAFAKDSISQLNLGSRSVYTIHMTKPCIEAFDLIRKKQVSGVAVVNEDGFLVGNLSSSDLKHIGFQGEKIGRLLQPIEMYVQLERDNIPLYCVREEDSLSSAIQKMIETNSHRLYIINSEKIPIGVVSLVDILKCFVSHLSIE
eukprot:TRINITY_DN144_c0_g1_i5.p1 TRINITY_DN144_c0_g1~~TRINITY_DN144_c0_g1_i5.p1  ORF type:complete len:311 (-),score=42.52 TRINITY_DN144_c0_g1_i5:36-968(-)